VVFGELMKTGQKLVVGCGLVLYQLLIVVYCEERTYKIYHVRDSMSLEIVLESFRKIFVRNHCQIAHYKKNRNNKWLTLDYG